MSHIQTMELAEGRRLKLFGKWENAIDIRLKWSETYTCICINIYIYMAEQQNNLLT